MDTLTSPRRVPVGLVIHSCSFADTQGVLGRVKFWTILLSFPDSGNLLQKG